MSEWMLWVLVVGFGCIGISALIEGKYWLSVYMLGALLVNLAVLMGMK